MNYYHDWWETARKQKPLILTKPKERELLLKRIKLLEAGTGKPYKELEIERDNWKSKYQKVKQELKETDEIMAGLAEENQQKDQTITDLQTCLAQEKQKYQDLETLTSETLQTLDKEKKLIQKLKKEKTELEKENKKALQEQKDLLATEKNKVSSLENQLAEQTNNFQQERKNLTQQISDLGQQITNLTDDNTNLTTQVNTLTEQKTLAKPAFDKVEELVRKVKIFLLPKKRKGLKAKVEEIRTIFKWGSVNPDWDLIEEGSTTTLPLDYKNIEATGLDLAEQAEKIKKQLSELENEPHNFIIHAKEKLQTQLQKLEGKTESKKIEIPIIPITTKPVPEKIPEKTIQISKKEKPLTSKEKKWSNINLQFTEASIKQWEQKGFNYERTKEWIDIGLTVQDANFAHWLVKTKKGNYAKPEWVLNYGNFEALRETFKKETKRK